MVLFLLVALALLRVEVWILSARARLVEGLSLLLLLARGRSQLVRR
jgi:hypothetical protein